MHCIITIDGPAGVGKSTLAKRLAAKLNTAYLDTGAMFRTIALAVATKYPSVDFNDFGVYSSYLETFHFALQGAGTSTVLVCNGKACGDEIRTEEAAALAARLAVVPQVREYLKKTQQLLGAQYALVAEGRDMGTVVFPEAQVKFFLDASVEVRAERRCRQLQEQGKVADLQAITKQIVERDAHDRNRPIAPLRPASDAVCIDTSSLNIEDVFAMMLATVSGATVC